MPGGSKTESQLRREITDTVNSWIEERNQRISTAFTDYTDHEFGQPR